MFMIYSKLSMFVYPGRKKNSEIIYQKMEKYFYFSDKDQ